MKKRLKAYFKWIGRAIPGLDKTRYRKPVDLYALIGALDSLSSDNKRLDRLLSKKLSESFATFALNTQAKAPTGKAAAYAIAASRQTDNLEPRQTRIAVLKELIDTGTVPA